MELLELLSPKNIVGFIIVVTRLSGMMVTAPLFSTYPIPPQVKAWLVAFVAFIMYPLVSVNTSFVVPTSMPEMTLFLIKEFAVGALIGFLASFLFVSVQMAGNLLAQQIGLAMSNMLDPATNANVPVIGQFYMFMTTLIFLALDAHQWLFAAVYQSFLKVPPGLEMPFSPILVQQVLHLSSQMFTVSISIVLPIFCVLFVLEILIGVLAKMIPQMNIFMVALPIKIYIGLVLMIMFLSPMFSYLSGLVETHMMTIMKMFM